MLANAPLDKIMVVLNAALASDTPWTEPFTVVKLNKEDGIYEVVVERLPEEN